MKKIIFYSLMPFLMAVCFLFSCDKKTKTEFEPVLRDRKTSFNSENANITQMRQDLLSFDLNIQKQLFNSLPPEKKAMLWDDKLSQVLSENNFSTYQKALIEDLKRQINENIYVVGSDEEVAFKDVFLVQWTVKAKGQFVFDELMAIITLLDDYHQNKIIVGGGTGDRYDDCECSTKSDWCNFGMTCRIKNCNDSAHGCGTLWTFACRGMCGWN